MGQNVEDKRAAHYAYLVSIMPELISRLSWSRQQIEAYQAGALREMLGFAKAHSPWYARRLEHIDAATVTLADLARIPVMNKNDLMENWDDIVTIPGATRREAEQALRTMQDQFYIWGNNVLLASGGTGGQPGIIVYDWAAIAMNWGGMSRSVGKYLYARDASGNVVPGCTVGIGAERSAHGSFVVGRIFADPGNNTHILSGWRSVDDLVPQLNRLQPQLISCYPHLIPALAAVAEAGDLKISPKVMAFGGEHMSEENRKLARRTWPNTHILTCWGTSEGGGTFPCPTGDGFHVSEDQVIIEPVDEHGAPVAPSRRSSGIYFTNLYNKALPIIRYYIDDVFEMDDKPCACGCAHRKVKQVHGRAFEKFRYGTVLVHPASLQLAIIEQPQILEYQFRQTPRGVHLAYCSKDRVDTDRLRLKLHEALASYGITDPDVVVEQVASLQKTKAGKLQRYVPLAA